MIELPSPTSENFFLNFLKKYFHAVKSIYGSEGVKVFAHRAGIKSRINFNKFLKGLKPIPASTQDKLFQALDLSFDEKIHFLGANESSQKIEKTHPQYFISEDFFFSPINTIILNLCGLEQKMTENHIFAILNRVYSDQEIENSIKLLKTHNLIELLPDNVLIRSFNGSLTTLPGIRSAASKQYFNSSYHLANLAWDLPLNERELNSFTFRMCHSDFAKVKSLVRKLRQDLSDLQFNTKPSDSVYQCSLAVVPLFTPEESVLNSSPE